MVSNQHACNPIPVLFHSSDASDAVNRRTHAGNHSNQLLTIACMHEAAKIPPCLPLKIALSHKDNGMHSFASIVDSHSMCSLSTIQSITTKFRLIYSPVWTDLHTSNSWQLHRHWRWFPQQTPHSMIPCTLQLLSLLLHQNSLSQMRNYCYGNYRPLALLDCQHASCQVCLLERAALCSTGSLCMFSRSWNCTYRTQEMLAQSLIADDWNGEKIKGREWSLEGCCWL